MKKKTLKILSIFLVLLSISAICYAGFNEVNISEEIPMNFFQRIKILVSYIVRNLLYEFLLFNYVDYEFLGIELDFYIKIISLLLYAILSLLIIKKKKELFKISLKINIIILLILLVIPTLMVANIINKCELMLVILTLLIISLIFQKAILKKDDEKIKKYNRRLRIVMIFFIIIELISCAMAYTVMFLIPAYDLEEILTGKITLYEYVYEDIDCNDSIIVEVAFKHTSPWYPTTYNRVQYTLSEGDNLRYVEGKVLDVNNEGILIQYTERDYTLKMDTNNGFDSIFNNYEKVVEEKETELKWNTWYRKNESYDPTVSYDGDTTIYIKLNNFSKGDK